MKKLLILCLFALSPSLAFAQSETSEPYALNNVYVKVLSVPEDVNYGELKVYRSAAPQHTKCSGCGRSIKFSRDIEIIIAKQGFGIPTARLLDISGQTANLQVGLDGLVSRLEIGELEMRLPPQ